MYDFLMIGGGVLGCAFARELSRYGVKVAVAEAKTDVCAAETRLGGVICAAHALTSPRPVVARYAVRGEKMFAAYSASLEASYSRTGCMYIFFSEDKARSFAAGCAVAGVVCRSLSPEEAEKMQPALASCTGARSVLFFPEAGVVDACAFVYALRENAQANGADFFFGFKAEDAGRDGDLITVSSSDGRRITARNVVNCSGNDGGLTARSLGDLLYLKHRTFNVAVADMASHPSMPLFYDGAGGVVPCPGGRFTVGADETDGSRETPVVAGAPDSSAKLAASAGIMPLSSSPAAFTRAYASGGDIYIAEGSLPGVRHILGAGSDGLTIAPALAMSFARSFGLKPRKDFRPTRRAMLRVTDLSAAERNTLALRDPAYGRLVLARPAVTQGEVNDAVSRGAVDVPGLDRRLLPPGVSGGVAFAAALGRAAGSSGGFFTEDK